MNQVWQPSKNISRLTQWLWVDLNWVWVLVAIAWFFLLTSGHSHFHLGGHAGMAGHMHDLTMSDSSMHDPSMHDPSTHHPLQPFPAWFTALSTGLYFLASWEVMIVAMMLPSVLPVARLFVQMNQVVQVNQNSPDRSVAQVAFVASYMTIWTGFAAAILGVSAIVPIVSRELVHTLHQWALSLPPLYLVQGCVWLGVGLFQFTPMKRNCLKGCRSAAMVIAQYYQPGWVGGWNLGIQHGLYCLGCCWALMVSMTLMGMEDLGWMLCLTAIMTLERVWKYGEQLASVVGLGLIGWGGWLLWLAIDLGSWVKMG